METFKLKIYVENVDFVKKDFIFGKKYAILYSNADMEIKKRRVDL